MVSTDLEDLPGVQADAELPEVKQQYFDLCLAASTSIRGSSEHAAEMDNCMSKYGYFRNPVVCPNDFETPQ